jgi:hypothetical protein
VQQDEQLIGGGVNAGGDVGNGFAELFDRRGFSSGKKRRRHAR